MNKIFKNKYIWLLLSVFATIFIFYNSMHTGTESDISSSHIVDTLNNFFLMIGINQAKTNTFLDSLTFIVRKTAHITEFFLQGICVFITFKLFTKNTKKYIIYVLFIGLFTACTDEFIQFFVEGRSSQVKDIFIDFTGVILSVFATIAIIHFLHHIRQKLINNH